ncbi:MAG TPA: SusD/RagB family nutrient-binding outer membrane lipoprotein [Hanamia sp.]|nr:SusD/RagB family nutrient-binding outer membrane lipoprotein [Hanamia sp.]
MKLINTKWLFLIIILSAGFAFNSCKKGFLDVNTDPNRVTDANVTAELIFPQAANAVGVREANIDFLFLDHWMGYIAQNGQFAPQQNELTYNIDFTFGNALFVNHYNTLFDLHQAEVKGIATGDTVLAGASIILAAKLWQELVDLYGDIPYSQVFQTDKYSSPVYDKAQDIYKDLQGRLDTAIGYMHTTEKNAFIAADIVNHGDQNKWILFANTLKLRLLIRQSEVPGFDPSSDITKILNNGGVLGAGQTVSVNPGYSNDLNKQNPYYAIFGWDPTGVVSTSADNANAYIVNILNSTNDPRIGRFFYPVGFSGGTYAGAVFGASQSTLPTAANLSYFGPGLVGTINSSNSGDGSGAKQNQWIFPSYESMFLYAEAVARGWITGDAQTAYMAAVTESFSWLGTPDAVNAAATYMSNNPSANWANAGTSSLSMARFIAYQKYIANTAIDPLESYSDLRRLNFLTDNSYISASPGKLSNTLPVKLLYPQSEYTSNAANVPKEVGGPGGDLFTKKIFWQP